MTDCPNCKTEREERERLTAMAFGYEAMSEKARVLAKKNSELEAELVLIREDNIGGPWKIIDGLKADRAKAVGYLRKIKEVEADRDRLKEELELLKCTLRIIAEPERQEKYTPQQLAKHALRMEPLQP